MLFFLGRPCLLKLLRAWQVMRGKNKADLKKLMSVSDSIADLNLGRFKNFLGSAKVEEGSPEDFARPAVSGSPPSTPGFPCGCVGSLIRCTCYCCNCPYLMPSLGNKTEA